MPSAQTTILAAIIVAAAVVLLAGAIAAITLIRARRSAARSQQELASLRSRVAEIAAMAGGLAHEIKNPLSTIGMNAQLLDEAIADADIDPAERARIGRRIGTLTRETERLRGILEDFLDYAGEMRLHQEPADLRPIVEELADFFHPEADKRGIRMRLEPPPTPLAALVDTPLLKQAILNLMINAAQAMEAQTNAARELIIRLDEGPASTSRIHIIDTGPGMSAEQSARAFEPYFTTKAGGTGLGLPTTRRIIEAHGGTLTLDTQPNRGTAFTINLPKPQDTISSDPVSPDTT